MLKMSAKIFFNSLIVSAFLFFSTIALRAQDQSQGQMQQKMQTQDNPTAQIASNLSEDLAGKLSLSDAQTKQLKDILVSYQEDVQGAVQSGKTDLSTEKATANAAVEDLLTDTQKTDWENTKADFWTTVDSKVSSTPAQQKSNDTY